MRLRPGAWISRALFWTLSVFVVYSLGTYFGVPPLLRYVATNQASASLHRPVSVGKVSFNPYKLRLILKQLRIGQNGASGTFVDIRRVNVRLSWTSLYRLAWVVKEVTVDGPSIHLVRTALQTFNASDLIQPASSSPPQKPVKREYFAISNIQLNDGQIVFDDEVLKQHHRIDKIRLDIPFIANLPTDVDSYITPLLRITVDGSHFLIAGKTKPFGNRESVVNFAVHRLDLTRYAGYVPMKLPAKLTSAILSSVLQVSFVEATDKPEIRVSGTIGVDNLDVHDQADQPLIAMKTLQVTIANLEPLNSMVHLSSIAVDSLAAHLVLNHDGTTNLTPIISDTETRHLVSQPAPRSPSAAPLSSPSPGSALPNPVAASSSVPTASPPMPGNRMLPENSIVAVAPRSPTAASAASSGGPVSSAVQFKVDSIQLANGAVEVYDQFQPQPVSLKLRAIHAGLRNLSNSSGARTSYDCKMTLAGGGQIDAAGTLDLHESHASIKLKLDQIDLPALQGLAQPTFTGLIISGKLSGSSSATTAFAPGHFELRAQHSEIAIDGLAVRGPSSRGNLVSWKHFDAKLASAELPSHKAVLEDVRTDGLQVDVQRGAGGNLNLLSLIRTQPESVARPQREPIATLATVTRRRRASERNKIERSPGRRAPSASFLKVHPVRQALRERVVARAAGEWQYEINSVELENSDLSLADLSQSQPLTIRLAPLKINLKDVSNDYSRPIGVGLEGRLNRKGTLKIAGNVAIEPLAAEFDIETQRLDLGWLDPLVTSELNARIMRMKLTMRGAARAVMRRSRVWASYRGNLAFGNVRIRDKVTGEDLLDCYSLNLDKTNLRYGEGPPLIEIGAIGLSDFYSRIILNSNGQLNLRDVMTNPQRPPTSLTRAHGELLAAAVQLRAAPVATVTPSTAATPAAVNPSPGPSPIPANIVIGGIRLSRGMVRYTDNFIQPNYSADLTEIEGTVGRVGSESSQPAAITLTGLINGSSPIDITGVINPLTPLAFLELKIVANGIALTPLAPYTTKYTGYPITEGTLTADVHYHLANQQLTAQNHIVLDQLTFGDRVANSSTRNLPIRLAVELLKDANGRIDLNLPVSGSLSDPQFSITGVIWNAVENLILKAVTSPFSLVSSALGGSSRHNLSYIEFAPGYATVTSTQEAKLDTVVKLLEQKDSLKLIITGSANPTLDRDGLRNAMLDYAIRRQKARGETGTSEAELDKISVTPSEYTKYLRRIYKAGNFEKPAGFMGMIKSLPPDQMEKLILTNTQVTDADLRKLAQARAEAIRKQLSSKIQLTRLQTLPPRLGSSGPEPNTPTTVAYLSVQ